MLVFDLIHVSDIKNRPITARASFVIYQPAITNIDP